MFGLGRRSRAVHVVSVPTEKQITLGLLLATFPEFPCFSFLIFTFSQWVNYTHFKFISQFLLIADDIFLYFLNMARPFVTSELSACLARNEVLNPLTAEKINFRVQNLAITQQTYWTSQQPVPVLGWDLRFSHCGDNSDVVLLG